jgi:uncharacterized protein
MVVDEAGDFVSQRTHPKLALVDVKVSGERLRIKFPGTPETEFSTRALREPKTVRVWRDLVQAQELNSELNAELSQFLQTEVRLVYFPDMAGANVRRTYFADSHPILLISEASLEDLNQRLESPVPMNRFRPNLVVKGCGPFEEDRWKTIAIGGVEFEVAKGCARCSVPTIDQETAEQGIEPMRTLSTFRKWEGQVWFGQKLIPRSSGEIRLGAAVEPSF